MNNEEWKDITDPEELFRLKREGWEIETNTPTDGYPWKAWLGEQWNSFHIYRARPRQPKMKKVKLLCWYDGTWLQWANESHSEVVADTTEWKRVPAEDKEIEVPDDN